MGGVASRHEVKRARRGRVLLEWGTACAEKVGEESGKIGADHGG